MALQKKADHLVQLRADIMVVQECSEKSVSALANSTKHQTAWFGTNKNNGIAVITAPNLRTQRAVHLGPTWAVHARLEGSESIDLFAVWACAGTDHLSRYIRQVHLMLDQISSMKLSNNTIVMGDFNSNAIWDPNYYAGRNHTEAVSRMSSLGLESAYHTFNREAQGAETQPTFHFRRKREAVYIDYIFLSKLLMSNLKAVNVGKFEEWIHLSDHMPVVVDVAV